MDSLPQELVDKFIDNLAANKGDNESRSALLACALVARSFHGRANHHMFSTLSIVQKHGLKGYIETNKRMEGLLQILEANPRIGPRVQSFTLEFNSLHMDLYLPLHRPTRLLIFAENKYLLGILHKLSSPRKLRLVNQIGASAWPEFGDLLSSAIHALCRLPSLTTVLLQNLRDVPPNLFSGSANLTHLRLNDVKWNIPKPGNPLSCACSPHPFPFSLKSASLKNAASFVQPLLRTFEYKAGSVFSHLERLQVTIASWDDFVATWEIVQRATQTLTTLDICDPYNLSSDLQDDPLVDIGLLSALRKIKITATQIRPDIDHRFPQSISRFLDPRTPTTCLETIEIYLSWVNVGEHFNPSILQAEYGWSALDVKLSGPEYPHLRKVVFQLNLGYRWNGEYAVNLTSVIEDTKELVLPYVKKVLPCVAASPQIDLDIVIQPHLSKGSRHTYLNTSLSPTSPT
ncbi:hypothetical protein B0H34DRAFT_863185 [Crassisporium funariophilum]|nr:hypothetical protein B0H34DRAFT_863185 [Crassisporium funariophilum]